MSYLNILKNLLRNVSAAKPKLDVYKNIANENKSGPQSKELFLIGTNMLGNWALLSVDVLIALALRARGKRVIFVTCDGALSACQRCEFSNISPKALLNFGPQKKLCNSCHRYGDTFLNALGFEQIKLSLPLSVSPYTSSQELSAEERSSLRQHGLSGLLRYVAKGDLESCTQEERALLSRFEESSINTYSAYKKIFEEYKPVKAIFHHGIYSQQGAAYEAAKSSGVDIVCWGVSYRQRTIILENADTYHRNFPKETSEDVFNFKFQNDDRQKTLRYLSSREKGVNDWISFSKRTSKTQNIHQSLGIDENNPIFLLLTNVIWDAQLHFEEHIYKNMMDWIIDTIEYFRAHPDKQLILRVHPAEVKGTVPSRQKVTDTLQTIGLQIPNNVFVVDAHDEEIDTYSLIEIASAAIVYGTKAAIEIAARGKRVIILGDAWCRNKGFTIEPASKSEYYAFLSNLKTTTPLESDKRDLAIQYAHYFFFRRMIPIESLRPLKKFAPFVISEKINSLDDIRKDTNLMLVADKIINSEKFEIDGHPMA